MGRADPGTVISELLSVQELVAPLAGSVNRRRRSPFDCIDANMLHGYFVTDGVTRLRRSVHYRK